MIAQTTAIDSGTLEKLKDIRQHLHVIAEVSEKEFETAKFIKSQLKDCQPDQLIDQLGGTGLLAIFDSGNPGPFIIFRAELDALPIQEINHFKYKSSTEGVSHKCGHDGHSTTLLGFAQWLAQNRPANGKVGLMFQPAEENGMGAAAILADEKWNDIHPDFVVAYHNLPGYNLGEIVFKPGSFTAAVKSIILKITGKTAHAAEPENGFNPAFTIADILQKVDSLSNNAPERSDFAVITPVHVNVGDLSYGIAAGYGELHLTIRTWTTAEIEKLEKNILEIAQSSCEATQTKLSVEFTQVFAANENDDLVVDAIRNAGEQLKLSVHERAYPFKWGEDFGLFTQRYKGAMFGIGAGKETPALHNPDYDFPDDILPIGIEMFKTIWQKLQ
ncbi:MAG: amidohydrolase [Saprospiraceae bacterium]|nr:amidohydrolase [Saprospiraceae bacterium]